MTKFNSLFLTTLSLMILSLSANAQKMPSFKKFPNDTLANNNYRDYVGDKAFITAPTSIAGIMNYTIANNGDGNNDWGATIGSLNNSLNNVEIVKADPYEACAALNNASAINGKIALIKRNTCEFGTKAKNAQDAGAAAVVIVNNSDEPIIGMAPGQNGNSVTIPVIMVSQAQGVAIENALSGGQVTMSFSDWSNGYTSDIGILPHGISLWHAHSVPLSQMQNSSSDIYKGFDGAVIANFGSTTANTVKMKVSVYWTPDGGSKSMVHADSVEITTPFTQTDSIITPFIDRAYSLNPTSTGKYDVEYEVTPDFVDQFPADNKQSYSFRVDNRIFSKGKYDHNKNVPYFSGSSRYTGDYIWGSMYYMEQAGYGFEHVKLAISKDRPAGSDSSMAGQGTVQVMVWKWVDNNDGIMVRSEMELVGLGSKTFADSDTSGQTHEVVITKPNDQFAQVVTEANTWYWVSAALPNTLRMPIDGDDNMFVRGWGREKATANPIIEFSSPVYIGTFDDFDNAAAGSADERILHWPFEIYYSLMDSIRYSQQKNGLIAAIPVQMSLNKVGVDEVTNNAPSFDVEIYPNPVSDVMNVNLDLAKEAKTINYTILNSVGEKVADVTRNNLKKDTYQVTTANLAAGTYYLIINADNETQSRKFTVIK